MLYNNGFFKSISNLFIVVYCFSVNCQFVDGLLVRLVLFLLTRGGGGGGGGVKVFHICLIPFSFSLNRPYIKKFRLLV